MRTDWFALTWATGTGMVSSTGISKSTRPRSRILDCAGICEDCPNEDMCASGCRNPEGTRAEEEVAAEMDAEREELP